MIARLSGAVLGVGATSTVVEVGGVGLRVSVTPDTAAALRVGQQAALSTTLIVREDALTLYGFATDAVRDFFELLLSATGVGPKLAQAALSVLSPDELRAAIAQENLVALTRVPGIGRKGAQRIVLELKDKVHVAAPAAAGAPAAPLPGESWREQVASGLQGLGWSARDAETACGQVEHLVREDPTIGVAAIMRAALQALAR